MVMNTQDLTRVGEDAGIISEDAGRNPGADAVSIPGASTATSQSNTSIGAVQNYIDQRRMVPI